MKTLLLITLLIFSGNISAECWKIGGLKGYSSRKEDGYKITTDGISKQTFLIEFSGEGSSVVPSNMHCNQIANYSVTIQHDCGKIEKKDLTAFLCNFLKLC